MKERPILFTGEMVKALLDGGKTQTRRIVKFPPSIQNPNWTGYDRILDERGLVLYSPGAPCWNEHPPIKCPYGLTGDRLWVREKFWVVERKGQGIGNQFLVYDNEWNGNVLDESTPLRPCDFRFGPHPSIHMPRWASRLTLEITRVRAERLNQISEADAIAEGIIKLPASGRYVIARGGQYLGNVWLTARAAYQALWESIHGPGSFDDRWVWVIDFRRCA